MVHLRPLPGSPLYDPTTMDMKKIIEIAKEEAKMLLEKEFEKNNVILIEKGVQILEKNVKIEYNANKWVLKGSFVVSFYNSEKEYKEVQVENIIQ